jgi:poly(ADP-ribose) glycohydrolase
MTLHTPFDPASCGRMSSLLAGRPGSLEEFRALRARLSGASIPLPALDRLCDVEPGFRDLLLGRVLPSVLAHARALLDGGPPQLELHTAAPARTELTRAAVAGWVAHMFLGTLPQRSAEHPHVDMATLLVAQHEQEIAKLRCVLAYFDRIAEQSPQGTMSVERVCSGRDSAEAWASDTSPLGAIDVIERGAIEEAALHRQVDFANMYLGGGVLSGGCVQEEIRFAVAPELLFGLLVSPRMRDDEAIVLRGAERFAATSGYAWDLRYAGPFHDPCPRGADGTPDVELVAIDAVSYNRRDPSVQWQAAAILRELRKASAGFQRDARSLPVATGNWGCGVFRGDHQLKAVIQWLAASAEGRGVAYYTFGDLRVGDLAGFAARARARHGTVGSLFTRLMQTERAAGGSFHDLLV